MKNQNLFKNPFFYILVFFVFIFVYNYFSPPKNNPFDESSSSVLVSSKSTYSHFDIGEDVLIETDQSQAIVVYTKSTYDELAKLSRARDEIGFSAITMTNRVFRVDSRTKAKIIDSSMDAFEIRIMSGEYFGSSGWVPREYCKKN